MGGVKVQSSSVTFMQSAKPKGISKAIHTATTAGGSSSETVSETPSSGQGITVSSARRSSANDKQFTTFLQKDKSFNLVSAGELGNVQISPNEEETKKTDPDNLQDISSLLVQLTLIGASAQSQSVADGDPSGTDQTVFTGISGVCDANSEAAEGIVLAGEALAAAGLTQHNEGSADAVFSHVVESLAAMKNEYAAEEPGQSGTAPAAGATTFTAVKTQGLNVDAAEKPEPTPATYSDGTNDFAASDVTVGKSIRMVSAVSGSQSESRSGGLGTQDKNDDNEMGSATSILQQAADARFIDEVPTEKTAAVEKALNRFADDLRSIKSGAQEIKIVLEPESLGVLTISVVKTEDGISAKIRSEDKEVVAAISDQIHKLVSSMQNKGINVKEVDVAWSQTEQSMSFAQQGFSHSREEASNGYTAPRNKNAEAETSDTDFWQGYYGTASGDTAIDYRV